MTLPVELLLTFLVAGLSALVFVMFSRDIPPKMIRYKIRRRFVVTPPSDHPNLNDAPYRLISDNRDTTHKPVLLNLRTSDPGGQACHPDVTHIAGGFGAGNWTYWMVCTPYAYTCAALENPELFVSYDGVIWDVPDGTINPLAPTPPNEGDHNSDPDMLFYEDQLWLYFRETRRAAVPNENSIRLMKSSDGIKWSVPVEVLRDTSGSELLSPAVIHNGDAFAMWTVERLEGAFKITRRTSEDGANWSLPAICDTNGLASGRILWHIDVIREPDRLSALIVSVSSHGGAGARIHYGHSLDQGFSWIVGPFLFDQAYEFETKWQYRGTLLKVAADPHLYQLWYSAATEQSAWSIAYLKAIREGNSLRPHSFGIPAKA